MTLFRLDASFRVDGSVSREVGDIVEHAWLERNPGATVVRRHIGTEPIPATAWGHAVTAGFVAEDERTPEQREAQALAAMLVDELVEADALLFAVPLYNFGVSQFFKSYIDLVVTDPRMAAGAPTAIQGKPAELVVTRGGNYRAGTPREGWDHATPYMRRILEDVWGLTLGVVETDFTLVGVNPALDEFTEMATAMRVESDQLARERGAALGAPAPVGAR